MRKLKLDQLNRLDVAAYKSERKLPISLALDNIRSGHNVGSAFRMADACLVHQIILGGYTPIPPHKEIFKTAIGATQSVDWIHAKDLHSHLLLHKSEANTQIIGIEQTDVSVSLDKFEVDPTVDYILVFGNEVQGIADNLLPLLDAAIEVPQFGTKHSLNVSVCMGIVLWHFGLSHLAKKER